MTSVQREARRELRAALKALMHRDKECVFLDPVDDEIAPLYSTIIQRPICFRDMEAAIEEGAYDVSGARGLLESIELMANNATQYNGPESEFHRKGQLILRAAQTLLAPKAAEVPKLPSASANQREVRRVLRGLLKRIIVLDKDLTFRDPVDTSVVTDYLDIVVNPMDFRTMERRLEHGMYDDSGADGILADVELIAANAASYNGDESEYAQDARAILNDAKAMVQAAKTAPSMHSLDGSGSKPVAGSVVLGRPAAVPNAAGTSKSWSKLPAAPPRPGVACVMCGKDDADLGCSKCTSAFAHIRCLPIEIFKVDKSTDKHVCLYCRIRAAQKSKGVNLPTTEEQECYACLKKGGGILVGDEKNRFCHLRCVLSTPGLTLNNSAKILGMPKIVRQSHESEDEDSPQCKLCGTSRGITSECAVCEDHGAVHAACLLQAGGTVRNGRLLCAQHSEHLVLATDESSNSSEILGARRCGVCFDDPEEGEALLVCDACQCAVHSDCYGLLENETPSPSDGGKVSWYCRHCYPMSRRGVQGACCLCPHPGGVLSPVDKSDDWCHIACALWTPEVSFANSDRQFPVTPTSIRNAMQMRRNLICSLCKSRAGACVQCSEPSCYASFHAYCAKIASLDGDTSTFALKCARHSEAASTASVVPLAAPCRAVGAQATRRPRSGVWAFAKSRPSHESAKEIAKAWSKLPLLEQRGYALSACGENRPPITVAAATAPPAVDDKLKMLVGELIPAKPAVRLGKHSDAWGAHSEFVLPRDVLPASDAWNRMDRALFTPESLLRLVQTARTLDGDACFPASKPSLDVGGAISQLLAKPQHARILAPLFQGSAMAALAAVRDPSRLVLYSPPRDALVLVRPAHASSAPRVSVCASSAAAAWALIAAALKSTPSLNLYVKEIVIEPTSETQRLAWLIALPQSQSSGDGTLSLRIIQGIPESPRAEASLCPLDDDALVRFFSLSAHVEWPSDTMDVQQENGSETKPHRVAAAVSLSTDKQANVLWSSSTGVEDGTPGARLMVDNVLISSEPQHQLEQRSDWPGTIDFALAKREAELKALELNTDRIVASISKQMQEWQERQAVISSASDLEEDHRRRQSKADEKLADKRRRVEYEANAFCFLCHDDQSQHENCIVFCDRCDAAVHQRCYGIPVVPEGEWLCDECAGVQGSDKPSLRRESRDVPKKEDNRYCLCRALHDDEQVMLECEGKCRDWYHPECVGLQECTEDDCPGYEEGTCIINAQGVHCIDVGLYRFACPSCSHRKAGSLTLYRNRPRGKKG